MNQGIIIIAFGKPLYGRMSFVLCVSIRNNSKLPIAIIHDGNALKDLSDEHKEIFSHQILVTTDSALSDSENSFRIKTEIYKHSPFQKTLLLDADVIMVPGANADHWFEELSGIQFTASCNGYYDYASKKHSRTDYPYWADVDAVKSHFSISDTARLPQINSSFVYFEKCHAVQELFRQAKLVWDDNTFESGKYRDAKTDEFCFNVACAITGIYPHQFPYRPLYFYFQSEQLSDEYIIDNFKALSVITDAPEERVIDLYNKWMDYYFRKAGYKKKFFYSSKTSKESRPVKGFWHIAVMNHWKEIVQEQLMILVNDGLYDRCEEILVNVAGSSHELESMIAPYPKIKIINRSQLEEHEFPAIAQIKSYAVSQKFYGFYFHTKGVSVKSDFKDNWRNLLNHYVLRNWNNPLEKVSGPYDIAGPNWFDKNNLKRHFSGNFYWFDSDYIKKLPEVYTLKKSRFEAEMWIGMGNPKVCCVIEHQALDHIKEWFPQRKIGIFWQIQDDYTTKMRLLVNSGLLNEANYSVAFTGGKMYDLTGFMMVSAGGYEEHLKSYCLNNPDALIAIISDNDGILQWKDCFEILERKGYDTVYKGDCMLWTTAALVNSGGWLSMKEAEREVKHRKYLLSGRSEAPKVKSVIGFWHICMINHYLEIIKEQLQLMLDSGLYEKAETIFVGCVGDDISKVAELFDGYRKIKILSNSTDITQYEFNTLKILRDKSLSEKSFYGFYIHTKGVSYPGNEGGKHWRDYMNHYTITKWKDNVDKLNEGFDTCGVKLITEGFPVHYSGNFFWFKSDYTINLPPIESLNKTDRNQAEFWLCSRNSRTASLCQTFVDYLTPGKFVP